MHGSAPNAAALYVSMLEMQRFFQVHCCGIIISCSNGYSSLLRYYYFPQWWPQLTAAVLSRPAVMAAFHCCCIITSRSDGRIPNMYAAAHHERTWCISETVAALDSCQPHLTRWNEYLQQMLSFFTNEKYPSAVRIFANYVTAFYEQNYTDSWHIPDILE